MSAKIFQCNNCESYFTSASVDLKKNAAILCGLCTIPTPGSRVKLPCKYNQYGCNQLVTGDECKEHEEKCKHRVFACPVLPSRCCNWNGKLSEILKHSHENHIACIVSNSVVFSLDIIRPGMRNFLMSEFNSVFVIQFRVDKNGLFTSINFLPNPNHVSLFEFELEIYDGNRMVFIDHGDVKSQDSWTTSTNYLNLIGNLVKPKFKWTVRPKCKNCDGSTDERMFTDDKGSVCSACVAGKTLCEYSKEGCRYTDTDEKIWKHSQYFCKYSNLCIICKRWLYTNPTDVESSPSLYDLCKDVHYAKHTSEAAQAGTRWLGTFDTDWVYRYVEADFGLAIFRCRRVDNCFYIVVNTPLKIEELERFMCQVELAHPTNSRLEFKRTLRPWYSQTNDYVLEICVNYKPKWVDDNYNVHIKIKFIKQDN